jgi:hypothetical protein
MKKLYNAQYRTAYLIKDCIPKLEDILKVGIQLTEETGGYFSNVCYEGKISKSSHLKGYHLFYIHDVAQPAGYELLKVSIFEYLK